MIFSVKYRDNSGALCEKSVEAANRSECLARCKADGIAPMSVRECGFSSQSAKKTTKKNDSRGGNIEMADCVLQRVWRLLRLSLAVFGVSWELRNARKSQSQKLSRLSNLQ